MKYQPIGETCYIWALYFLRFSSMVQKFRAGRRMGFAVKNRAGKLTVSICKQSMVNSKSSLLEVGQERQRLQEILMQNHRELLELSTTTTPDDKKAWGMGWQRRQRGCLEVWGLRGRVFFRCSVVSSRAEALCMSTLGQTTTKSAACVESEQ